jgi:hypothetical protein
LRGRHAGIIRDHTYKQSLETILKTLYNYMNLSETVPFIVKKHIFFVLLFIYQYMIMSAQFYNIRIGDSNLQITITSLLFIICVCLNDQVVIRRLGWQVILILYFGLMFITLKIITGKLELSGIQGMRLFYMLPLFWSLYNSYANDDKSKDTVRKVIVWNSVFIAIYGSVHSYFFSPGSPEAAFFGNPSQYGCILVTGLFGIYLSEKRSILDIVIFFMIFLATFLSGSRWASLFSIIVLIMFFKDYLQLKGGNSKDKYFTLIIALCALYAMIVQFPVFLNGFLRAYSKWGIPSLMSGGVEHLTVGRFPGYEIALRSLFSNLSYFLLGGTQWEDFARNGIIFSDNSFIFLAIGYGIPLAILWILFVLFKMVPILRIKTVSQIMILVFFYGTIFSTPGLFWDPWILYILGILHYANGGSCLRSQKERG